MISRVMMWTIRMNGPARAGARTFGASAAPDSLIPHADEEEALGGCRRPRRAPILRGQDVRQPGHVPAPRTDQQERPRDRPHHVIQEPIGFDVEPEVMV